MTKELRELARVAEAQGWEVTPTNSGHVRWRPKTGGLYFSGGTPSDKRALRNLRAALVRRGLQLT